LMRRTDQRPPRKRRGERFAFDYHIDDGERGKKKKGKSMAPSAAKQDKGRRAMTPGARRGATRVHAGKQKRGEKREKKRAKNLSWRDDQREGEKRKRKKRRPCDRPITYQTHRRPEGGSSPQELETPRGEGGGRKTGDHAWAWACRPAVRQRPSRRQRGRGGKENGSTSSPFTRRKGGKRGE